jgi:hypothetical protein
MRRLGARGDGCAVYFNVIEPWERTGTVIVSGSWAAEMVE